MRRFTKVIEMICLVIISISVFGAWFYTLNE